MPYNSLHLVNVKEFFPSMESKTEVPSPPVQYVIWMTTHQFFKHFSLSKWGETWETETENNIINRFVQRSLKFTNFVKINWSTPFKWHINMAMEVKIIIIIIITFFILLRLSLCWLLQLVFVISPAWIRRMVKFRNWHAQAFGINFEGFFLCWQNLKYYNTEKFQ